MAMIPQLSARHWLACCLISSIFFFAPGLLLQAQEPVVDTLHLDVQMAEGRFLQSNLGLLANKYNIEINKALVQQAKVWDNPVLNTDQTLYDGRFFRHTTGDGQQYGQLYIQVQQLIRTAGKIRKQTQLAQDNVLTSEAQFNDLLRNLRFTLDTDLNNLAQLQQVAAYLQAETTTMRLLTRGMDEMLKTGDVSQKENVRIKALLFSLQNDYADNLRQQYDLQKELSMLLQLQENVWIVADAASPCAQTDVNQLSIADLQDQALQNRPDLQFTKGQSTFQQHNIAYQKSLAVPDVTVSPEYDRLNSYVPNYFGLGISLPLPVFNRNKGNIKAAELSYKQSEVVVNQVSDQVHKEVMGAWQKLRIASSLLDIDNLQLKDNYEKLMRNMVDSYRQHQISLVEFLDFFDAYKDTRIKQSQQIANQRNAAAELNYSTSLNIVKL